MVSPPYSSGTSPYSVSWPRTLVGSAPTLSILFTATTTGTSAASRVVERLDRLRHHAVVGRHHQHGDVGRLGAPGAHGGERLVARGVDEGDRPLVAVDLGRHLVGADRLGDAPGLARHHVGLADGVQQLGLAVVDVTHDSDHRRARREILLATFVLAELDVEALQQLAVLVLGRDDLDVVVELRTEHLQGVVGHRLGRGHHLAQVEQHLDQRGRVRADLLGQVGQRCAASEPDVLPVTGLDPDAADRRRLHLVELLTALLLGLAATTGRTTGPAEGTLRATATTAAAATAGRRTARRTTGTAATGRTASGAPAGAPGPRAHPDGHADRDHGATELAGGLPGHHRRVGPGHARYAGTPGAAAGRVRPADVGRQDGAGSVRRTRRRRRPMPWDGAKGLLPGRGVPGTARCRPAGQAAGRTRSGPRARLRLAVAGVPGCGPAQGGPGAWGTPGGAVVALPAAALGRTGSESGGAAGGRGPRRGPWLPAAPELQASPPGAGPRQRRRGLRRCGRSGRPRRLALLRPVPRRPWRPGAAFLAVFFAGGGSLASFSLSRLSTGASTVEEADRTNSPMSFNMVRTVLLSTPSSFASS